MRLLIRAGSGHEFRGRLLKSLASAKIPFFYILGAGLEAAT